MVTLARSAQRRIDDYLAGRDPAEAPRDAADVRRALSAGPGIGSIAARGPVRR